MHHVEIYSSNPNETQRCMVFLLCRWSWSELQSSCTETKWKTVSCGLFYLGLSVFVCSNSRVIMRGHTDAFQNVILLVGQEEKCIYLQSW